MFGIHHMSFPFGMAGTSIFRVPLVLVSGRVFRISAINNRKGSRIHNLTGEGGARGSAAWGGVQTFQIWGKAWKVKGNAWERKIWCLNWQRKSVLITKMLTKKSKKQLTNQNTKDSEIQNLLIKVVRWELHILQIPIPTRKCEILTRWWFQIILSSPLLGEDSHILTNILCKLGWFNHQAVKGWSFARLRRRWMRRERQSARSGTSLNRRVILGTFRNPQVAFIFRGLQLRTPIFLFFGV